MRPLHPVRRHRRIRELNKDSQDLSLAVSSNAGDHSTREQVVDSIHRRRSLLPFTINSLPPFTYSRPLHDRAGYPKVSGEYGRMTDILAVQLTCNILSDYITHLPASFPRFTPRILLFQAAFQASQNSTSTSNHQHGEA